jgi:dTDP-4-amino-4,6-dideoxygalactose transaminase
MSAYHLYVLRVDFEKIGMDRGTLMRELKARDIGTQVHYLPVPMHPYYQKFKINPLDYKNATSYYKQALSIPLYFDLTDNQQDKVVNALRDLVG